MTIYTRLTVSMITGEVLECETQEYDGVVDLCCGASGEEKQAYQTQVAVTNQLTQQAQQIFGASSGVFHDLLNAYSPIVANGPSQKGFSPAEDSALRSEAITDTGNAYEHARQAVGEHQAAQGGGTIALPNGASDAADINLAEQGAAQTAGNLMNVEKANYDTGRSNFFAAAKGLDESTGVFNPATAAGSAESSAASEAAKTASDITQANNSWVSSVTGMLGGIAGNMLSPGGLLNKKKDA